MLNKLRCKVFGHDIQNEVKHTGYRWPTIFNKVVFYFKYCNRCAMQIETDVMGTELK